MLEWQANFELGQPTIDEQHRKWFQLTNVFLKRAYRGEAGQDAIQKALEEVVAYARYHFTAEEEFMRAIGYEETSLYTHIQVHDEFVARINELAGKCRLGDPETGQEMVDFLTNWLKHHIVATDVKYIRFYKRVGKKISTLAAERLRRTTRRRRRQ